MKDTSFQIYSNNLSKALASIDQVQLEILKKEIYSRLNGESRIFILGNGGSAGNASHICGDYTKTFSLLKKSLHIICPTDSVSFYTATVNDIDQNQVFSILVDSLIKKNDLLIYLSGSGNSLNLIKAAMKANLIGIKQACITAFTGGKLLDLVDIPIHIKMSDMEIAEDCQIAIFHYLKQSLCNDLKSDGEIKIGDSNNSNRYNKRVGGNEIA